MGMAARNHFQMISMKDAAIVFALGLSARQHWFLVNVASDPGERSNVAAEHPDIVARLRQLAPVDAK